MQKSKPSVRAASGAERSEGGKARATNGTRDAGGGGGRRRNGKRTRSAAQ